MMTYTLSPLPDVPPRARRPWALIAVALVLVVALLGPAGAQHASSYDPAIAGMMAQMTSDTLLHYVSELSGEMVVYLGNPPAPETLMTRYSRSPGVNRAAQYLMEFYQHIGLSVETQHFGDGNWPNVIATLPGTIEPDKIIILCAHFDSISDQPMTWAPGADDNGSGTATLMAAAEILKNHSFAYTIRFAHFSGEEQGMLGSKAYAQLQRAANANIVGVVNLDMLAWNSDSAPIMELHAGMRADSFAVATAFVGVIGEYGLPLQPEVKQANSISASDHSSFWTYDYPAVLAIEDWDDFNAHYHTTADRVSAFNVPYFTALARASLGTIAVLAYRVADAHRHAYPHSQADSHAHADADARAQPYTHAHPNAVPVQAHLPVCDAGVALDKCRRHAKSAKVSKFLLHALCGEITLQVGFCSPLGWTAALRRHWPSGLFSSSINSFKCLSRRPRLRFHSFATSATVW
jgi:hypothetical protein